MAARAAPGRREGVAALPVRDARAAAARAGVLPGDCIAQVNGIVPVDVLDLEMAAADGVLRLTVLRDGRPLQLVVNPRRGEWHGISLGHDGIGAEVRLCRNHCRFCFVDQVPPGLRETLYVKDDDYRLSFLCGNFTTLTNLAESDVARLEELRLSPLYVSLHVWDDDARVRLMGEAARGSRRTLERLAAAGLEMHLQVVLCPGWNDGELLDETVARAAGLPAVVDLGIVPVSLAEEGALRRVTPDAAAALLEVVEVWQEGYRRERGAAFVHAADEFYLLRGGLPPASDAPEQYENGIGVSAALLAEAAGSGGELVSSVSARVLCGTLALPVIARAAELLAGRGISLRPFPVVNRLFGDHVTVTGLLGGDEVLVALGRDPLAADEWLLAPRVFMPTGLDRTLDDVREDRVAAACGGRFVLAGSLTEGFARLPG